MARSHLGVAKPRTKKDKDEPVPLHEFMQRQAKEARGARAKFDDNASDNDEEEPGDDEPEGEGQPEGGKMEMKMCGWISTQPSNYSHRMAPFRLHRHGPFCLSQRPTRRHGPTSSRE